MQTAYNINSTVANLEYHYTSIMQNLYNELELALKERGYFDFEDNGFEDEAGNTLMAADNFNVYFEGGEEYPLRQLGFLDGIEILKLLAKEKEENEKTKA